MEVHDLEFVEIEEVHGTLRLYIKATGDFLGTLGITREAIDAAGIIDRLLRSWESIPKLCICMNDLIRQESYSDDYPC